MVKLAVLLKLANKRPTKDEIGESIGICLKHKLLRDKFAGINEELEKLGYERMEVLKNAFRFVKKKSSSKALISADTEQESENKLVINKGEIQFEC